MSVLFYRRPDYVERTDGPLNWEDCQKYVERTKGNRHNIPEELSFENVVNDKALPVRISLTSIDQRSLLTDNSRAACATSWIT